jgi:2-polyprenyl-3-methyl-5-hydroxy-6-metoxy-1,4-benzoquinol methylase
MSQDNDQAIKAHYTAYPYPARDPKDEKKRLIEGSPSRLAEIEHYLFNGQIPESLSILIAGGGSGDAAIMLAQQMAWRGAKGEVVWLDQSQAAREIAEARASVRGLTNIHFVEGSLLEAERHVGKAFDYIDCCGVLHHLDEPEAGIGALRSVI